MNVQTYLPVFSGFYGSMWEFDYNTVEDFIIEERKEKNLFSKIDFNNLKINYREYEKDIVKNFCNVLPNMMKDFIIKIELQEIIRPKEYNFANDSANVNITINQDNIKNFIYANKEKFSEFLKNRYTSYDGFISHYENDFKSWEDITKNFSDFYCDGHRIGSILEFIAIMEGIKEFNLFELIIDDVYPLNYVENLDDVINIQDGSLFEFLTSKGIEKTFAEYLETSYKNDEIKNLSLSGFVLASIKEYQNA